MSVSALLLLAAVAGAQPTCPAPSRPVCSPTLGGFTCETNCPQGSRPVFNPVKGVSDCERDASIPDCPAGTKKVAARIGYTCEPDGASPPPASATPPCPPGKICGITN